MSFKPNYIIIPVLVFGVLYCGSLFIADPMVWYSQLALPPATPPKWVFPIVWNIIAALTALSLLLFYNRSPRNSLFWTVIGLFVANGLLNVAWTVVFFGWHQIGLAWWVALALESTLLALLFLVGTQDRIAALLLVPYALWVFFALYLNAQIWMIN